MAGAGQPYLFCSFCCLLAERHRHRFDMLVCCSVADLDNETYKDVPWSVYHDQVFGYSQVCCYPRRACCSLFALRMFERDLSLSCLGGVAGDCAQ